MSATKNSESFLKALSKMDFADYFPQYTALSKKQFLNRDLKISPRLHQQWKELGITPSVETATSKGVKREWVKLDFVEFLWMKIVISLRELGYPYEDIKKAKEFLFTPHDLGISMDRAKEDPELINGLLDHYTKNTQSDEMKTVLIEALKNPVIIDKISSLFSKQRPLLELIVFEAIDKKKSEIGIGFFEKGECLPFQWDLLVTFDKWGAGINKDDVLNNTIRKPHIYISVTKFIIDFIAEDDKRGRELIFSILNEEEKILLRELKNKDYKNITLNYDKGTDTKIIKTEREKKIKESEIKDFIKNIVFAPNCKTTYTKTIKGDLIINTISTKKLNT